MYICCVAAMVFQKNVAYWCLIINPAGGKLDPLWHSSRYISLYNFWNNCKPMFTYVSGIYFPSYSSTAFSYDLLIKALDVCDEAHGAETQWMTEADYLWFIASFVQCLENIIDSYERVLFQFVSASMSKSWMGGYCEFIWWLISFT